MLSDFTYGISKPKLQNVRFNMVPELVIRNYQALNATLDRLVIIDYICPYYMIVLRGTLVHFTCDAIIIELAMGRRQ